MKCPCCSGSGYTDEEKDPEGIFALKYGCYYCKNMGVVGIRKVILWWSWEVYYLFTWKR